jgi:type I restriction enzyme, R subunit
MQDIARVNRVFRDKPGGLVVDYLGLADRLKHALATCTESGGKGDAAHDPGQAIAVMLEKHGIASDMLHGLDWRKSTTGKPAEQLALRTTRTRRRCREIESSAVPSVTADHPDKCGNCRNAEL